jgi:hypothetical protein
MNKNLEVNYLKRTFLNACRFKVRFADHDSQGVFAAVGCEAET